VLSHYRNRKIAVVQLIKPYQFQDDSVTADSDTDSDDVDSADADESADEETNELLSASESALKWSSAPASKLLLLLLLWFLCNQLIFCELCWAPIEGL